MRAVFQPRRSPGKADLPLHKAHSAECKGNNTVTKCVAFDVEMDGAEEKSRLLLAKCVEGDG